MKKVSGQVGAAVGAALGSPIPLIGAPAGAALGADHKRQAQSAWGGFIGKNIGMIAGASLGTIPAIRKLKTFTKTEKALSTLRYGTPEYYAAHQLAVAEENAAFKSLGKGTIYGGLAGMATGAAGGAYIAHGSEKKKQGEYMDLFDRFVEKRARDFGTDFTMQGAGSTVNDMSPTAMGSGSATYSKSTLPTPPQAVSNTGAGTTTVGKTKNFFKQTGSWIKANPGKAGLIGAGGLVLGALGTKALSSN